MVARVSASHCRLHRIQFTIGRAISRTHSGLLLGIAIAANLGLLGYFKYYNLFALGVQSAGGAWAPYKDIVLPLAISFFTFEQISYLVDCRRKAIDPAPFWDYVFFVTFFPKLIAGPIIRYRELAEQNFSSRIGVRAADLAPGLTLFIIGLGKKCLLADTAALAAAPTFAAAAAGSGLSPSDAWIGVLAYSMQIYFDFSGYSDMALGLAMMFGLRLPQNFNSPYKSQSMIDFWRRWHITLSRFLRDYLYIPLGGSRCGPLRRYLNLIVVMVLGGLWHGAGLTFIAWGFLHGVFLAINHLFRELTNNWRPTGTATGAIWRATCWSATLFVVVVAWVFFRADTFASAFTLLGSMFGVSEAATATASLPPEAGVVVLLLCVVALFFPNSNEIVRGSALPLSYERHPAGEDRFAAGQQGWLEWRPSIAWAAGISVIFVAAVATLFRPSPFLYFQF